MDAPTQSLTSSINNNNNHSPDRTPAYCVTTTTDGNRKASLHRGTHSSNTNGLNSSRSLDGSGNDGADPTNGTRFSKFINSIKYALGSGGSSSSSSSKAPMLVGDCESSSSSSSRTSSTRPLVIKSTSVIQRTATHSSSSSNELTTDYCPKRGGRHKATDGPQQTATANGAIRSNRRRT